MSNVVTSNVVTSNVVTSNVVTSNVVTSNVVTSGVVTSGVVTSNVVQLQPAGGNGARSRAAADAREAPALTPVPDAIRDAATRDGLDLLKAFFAIDDAAARAALILLAQRLAQSSRKR